MSDSSNMPDVIELLAGSALGDLSAEEQNQLAAVGTEDTEIEARDLELAAAAVQLMFSDQTPSEMPVSLRAKIRKDAAAYVGGTAVVEPSIKPVDDRSSARISGREVFAWLAVAASLLLAIGAWVTNQPETVIQVTASVARNDLINSAGDLVRVEWGPGKTPFESEVEGDVVWSTRQQTGYMRFVGMPVNDPSIEQYQLWIIDPDRDEEPIDGGVFDVDQAGEVIVPIDAKLAVINPAAFAVTIEKPGGVVVSTQERLPLLAAVN